MYNARKIEKQHFTVFPLFDAFITENTVAEKITQTRNPDFQMR
jgi:hypothetical protein